MLHGSGKCGDVRIIRLSILIKFSIQTISEQFNNTDEPIQFKNLKKKMIYQTAHNASGII